MLGVLVGSIFSVTVGNISNFIEADAENKLSDLPTIDTFVANAVGTITWPDGTSFTPSNLVLNDTLLISGDVA